MELKAIMKSLASKSCNLDPAPTWIVKMHLEILLPFLCRVVNLSLSGGQMPACLKRGLVRPCLKKNGMTPECLKNYRPITNIPFLSKVIEKAMGKICLLKSKCISQFTYLFSVLPSPSKAFLKEFILPDASLSLVLTDY